MQEVQKILIVDDKPENLCALERILSRTDAEVIQADSGNDALIASLNHHFALAILDAQMPGMDGCELAELLRSQENTRNLPIIFLTAVFRDEHHIHNGYEAGAVDFITKPFDPAVLLGKVTVFLELDRQRAQTARMGAELQRINELEKKVRQRTRTLEEQTRQLRHLAQQLSETEERERRQLAELLHDDLQQLIASAKFLLSGLTNTRMDRGSRSLLDQVQEVLSEALTKSRRLSHELSPPVLHQGGLLAALKWLAQDVQSKHGVTISLQDHMQAEVVSPALTSVLYRSVKELVFNAIKHSGVRNIIIDARADGAMIEIEVRDHGKGFNPDQYRIGMENRSGFGLLSIQERISFLGGRMEIDTRPGKGCCVTLAVSQEFEKFQSAEPCHMPPSIPDRMEKAAAPENGGTPPPGNRIRLLLADDHAVMREGLARVFENEKGFEVVAQAATGLETIHLANELNPDVILMDISMPEMDGIEATARISKQRPGMIIIGLSMHEDQQTRESVIAAGAADFMSKSAAAREIINTVRLVYEQAN